MSLADLFAIDTFTATGREVPEVLEEVLAEVLEEDGGAARTVEVAEPAASDDRDEWDAETLDEIPEVDEIGEAVHDDPPVPLHAFLRPRPRVWSRPGSQSGA
jgi:hypothetical protein